MLQSKQGQIIAKLVAPRGGKCTVCAGRAGAGKIVAEATVGDNKVVVCEHCLQSNIVDGALEHTVEGLLVEVAWLRSLKGRIVLPSFADWQARSRRT